MALKIVNLVWFPQPRSWNPQDIFFWTLPWDLDCPKRQLHGQRQLLQPKTIS